MKILALTLVAAALFYWLWYLYRGGWAKLPQTLHQMADHDIGGPVTPRLMAD